MKAEDTALYEKRLEMENIMDCINIYDLLVFANHGVLREENVLGQKFVINAAIYLDTTDAAKNDDVEKTVNYALVCRMITEHFMNNTYKLIETAANETADMLLNAFPIIAELEIEVKKPWAPVHLALDSVSVKIRRKRHKVYIGLGSNMGDREKNIETALKIIDDDELSFVVKSSKLIETKPYGYEQQGNFVNGAAIVGTMRTPEEFLELIGFIEEKLDRVRQIHWGPRTIDVDILLYDDKIINTDKLTIPHYEMHKRDFVLSPLNEIAPQAVHPVFGKTIACLWNDLRENS